MGLRTSYNVETEKLLTNDYVYSVSHKIKDVYQLCLDLIYSAGSGEVDTSCDLVVQVSNKANPINSDFFTLPAETINTDGLSTFKPNVNRITSGQNIPIAIPIGYQWFRVGFKENGVTTNYGNTTIIATQTAE